MVEFPLRLVTFLSIQGVAIGARPDPGEAFDGLIQKIDPML
jgi:hypothetical protein